MIEIPGYTILRPLGQGGMATVYLAVQQSLGREVALKILSPALARDEVATERFLREARIAAKLHHPHIVAIHDVGVHEGTPFMSISYEAGGTVAQTTRSREDPKFAFRIMRDIASALDYAHSQGVVHRDVKPENILLRPDGNCVLSDFGIAHAIEAQTGLTREGTSVGTPHYMSPEQLRGEHGDGRSDLYSLGVVFYQLLTGDLPYQGTDGWAIGMQHIMAPIPRLPARYAYLQELLDGLLAKDPSARLQTGAEVVRWIDARVSLQTPAMTVAMPSARTETRPSHVSMAVLPFVDLSPQKDQEYFVDGLTEELLNLLARVPKLHVASRTATAGFRGRNASLAEIGRELKVASVLEGSVRKAGERVRIAVQLINVADGFNLWSETYNRDLDDVFAVQEEVARAVIEALKEKLLPPDAPLPDPELALQLQLARERLAGDTREDAEAAIAAFARVLELEPTHAEAKYGSAAAQRSLARMDAAEAAERAAAEAREQAAAERAAAERAAAEAREQAAAERAAAEQREREAAERAAEEARRREAAEKAAEEAHQREQEAAARAAEQARQREAAERAAEEKRQRDAAERAAADARAREQAERAAEEARQRAEAEHAAELAREREAAERAAEAARQRDAAERAAEAAHAREEQERAAAEEARQREAAAVAALAAERARQHEALDRAAEQLRQREAAERAAEEQRKREAAERAAEEQRQREAAERAAQDQRQREAGERIAEEKRQWEAAERAAAEERQRKAVATDPAEAARLAAAAAPPLSTLVIPSPGRGGGAAMPPPPPSSPAERVGGARAPDPAERAIAFASAMDTRPDTRPPPAKPAKTGGPMPMVIGGVVVVLLLAAGGWWFMQRQAANDVAQCQTLLGDAQAALAASDISGAEAATKQALGVCTGPAAERLATLTTEIGAARTREQTCLQAEAQAGDHLGRGAPKLARVVLDGARAGCATREAFLALDKQAGGAEAEAQRLLAEAAAQLKAGDVAAADASLKQALAADAELADTGALRAEIDKRLAAMPKPSTTTEPVATAPAKPEPAKPEPPKPEPTKPEPAKPSTPTETAPVATTPPPTTPKPSTPPKPSTLPAPAPTPVAPIATAPAPVETPAAAPVKKDLVGISTPQPNYPLDALRSGTTGKVTATFTVNPDGSVSGVRIVKATPRGVFDRAVLDTVGKWRYQPIDAPREVTRTFTFAQ